MLIRRHQDSMEYLQDPLRQERGQETAALLQKLSAPIIDWALEETASRLETDEPIFWQERRGQNNSVLLVPKILTIEEGLQDQTVLQGRSDDRAKGLSRVYRYTHLDELLQLQLVVDGTMDLDGFDRPMNPKALAEMEEADPALFERYYDLSTPLRPSLFSIGALFRHVHGGWGARVGQTSMRASLAYMERWASRPMDLAIRALTPPGIVVGAGIYKVPKMLQKLREHRLA